MLTALMRIPKLKHDATVTVYYSGHGITHGKDLSLQLATHLNNLAVLYHQWDSGHQRRFSNLQGALVERLRLRILALLVGRPVAS